MLEGSVPDDQALQSGYLAAMGTPTRPARRGPLRWQARAHDGLDGRPRARRRRDDRDRDVLHLGGIPAAAGNVTGSMGLMDFLGAGYKSARGIPVINVPGCAPQGDNFTETLAAVVRYLVPSRSR